MNQCIGFSPVVNDECTMLILGSMPGLRSLERQEYYAHPQNRFWPLIASLYNEGDVPKHYSERLRLLLARRIALWDVLAACTRPGSLDCAISDEKSNDFAAFFKRYPKIEKICFNGNKAYASFKKHQRALLADANFTYEALPSTSPANAKWRTAALIARWREALPRK